MIRGFSLSRIPNKKGYPHERKQRQTFRKPLFSLLKPVKFRGQATARGIVTVAIAFP
jgi:hypothetical protein